MSYVTYVISFAVIAVSLLAFYYLADVSGRKRRRRNSSAPDFGLEEVYFLEMIKSRKKKCVLEAKIGQIDVNAKACFVTATGAVSETTYSLLMFASHHHNLEALELLLQNGADPQWRNNRGTTVMHFCARRGQIEEATLCLEALKSDEDRVTLINQENEKGLTPLQASIQNNQKNFKAWLLKNGGTIASVTADEAKYADFGPKEQEFLGLMKPDAKEPKLEDKVKSINVNAKQLFIPTCGKASTTYSLLMYASYHSNFDALKLLLENDADPLWRNNRGTTVLGFMAKRGQLEMAKLVLEFLPEDDHFEFINQGTIIGWTPLHSAIQNKRMAFADWLLLNGADPNAAMSTGWTPMHTAAKMSFEAEKKLKARGGDCNKRAFSRCFGKNTSPLDVTMHRLQLLQEQAVTKAKIDHLQAAKALTGSNGQKALVVIINFIEFDNLPGCQEKRRRDGAEMDELFLGKAFEEKIDCEVMMFDDEHRSKDNYKRFIYSVQSRIEQGGIGILFCVISSHGGQDTFGQFFCDSHNKRIYIRQELKDCFSIDRCAKMEDKCAVFLINACRNRCPDAEEPDFLDRPWTTREAKHLTVKVCTTDSPAVRHKELGSACLTFFKQVLFKYGASISVQNLFRQTQKEYLDKYLVPSEGNSVYQQRLEQCDNINEDIFFRDKQAGVEAQA